MRENNRDLVRRQNTQPHTAWGPATRISGEAGNPAGQLYNLKVDPSEASNVWEDHPEVVEKLQAELKKTREDGRSR